MRKGTIGGRVFFRSKARIYVGRAITGALLCSCLAGPPCAIADHGWERPRVGLTWDNDVSYGTDRHYTQGAQLTYDSADDALPRWASRLTGALPSLGFDVEARKWGIVAGQQIFTPDRLGARDLIEDDRPYAAWLFAGFRLQRRGLGSFGWPAMETVGLEAGVVGPEALGREAQGAAHLVEPRGWRNQLPTEPGFILHYNRRYLCRRDFRGEWDVDLIPHLGLAGGNIHTHGAAGATVRVGWNIPNEFEVPKERTPFERGAYFFMGIEGRAVAHNIFLDGTTMRDSHHVAKKVLVGDFKAGISIVLKRVELTASQTFRSREFDRQKHNDSFGTATLVVKF